MNKALLWIILCAVSVAQASEPAALAALPQYVAFNDRLHVSGQPDATALSQLRYAGVQVVLDLREDAETPDLDEKAVVEASGLVYAALPVSGADGLTRENVTLFDKLLHDNEAKSVLVHCGSGNRVGAMMALRARWLQGKSAEEALALGKAAGLTRLSADVEKLLETNAAGIASRDGKPVCVPGGRPC